MRALKIIIVPLLVVIWLASVILLATDPGRPRFEEKSHGVHLERD